MNPSNKEIEKYCSENSTPASEFLQSLFRDTHLRTLSPQMMVGHIQGRLLSFLSKLIKPKFILEVGTFTGYSTICLLEGCTSDGKLVTIEGNEERIPDLINTFKKIDSNNQILLKEGQALDIIPELDFVFDLIFIDAAKNEYREYFNLLLDKMHVGSVMLIDNVLWFGKVMGEKRDNKGMSLDAFNMMVKEDKRVENFILPIRDGLQVVRKISD